MRCPQCREYIPDGAGFNRCPACESDLLAVPSKEVSIATDAEVTVTGSSSQATTLKTEKTSYKVCSACHENNNPKFSHCWKCHSPLMNTTPSSVSGYRGGDAIEYDDILWGKFSHLFARGNKKIAWKLVPMFLAIKVLGVISSFFGTFSSVFFLLIIFPLLCAFGLLIKRTVRELSPTGEGTGKAALLTALTVFVHSLLPGFFFYLKLYLIFLPIFIVGLILSFFVLSLAGPSKLYLLLGAAVVLLYNIFTIWTDALVVSSATTYLYQKQLGKTKESLNA